MRSVGRVFDLLGDADHLDAAARETVRGKRRRPDVAWFLMRRESVLDDLSARLRSGSYRPDGFNLLLVHDPKPRVIARSSIEDRIVHTAVVSLIAPIFLCSAIDQSYACRAGLGAHRATIKLLEYMRRFRFVVHLDIKKYFPSIDLGILRGLLAARIRDRKFLDVVDHIVESGRGLYDAPWARRFSKMTDEWPPRGQGLPIGALTSQLFAGHVYLNAFDHFVKRELRVAGYVRYMDDFFLFGSTREEMRRMRGRVGRWLAEERRLRLKYPNARIVSCCGHLDALGYRVRRDGIAPLPRKPLVRLQKRIRRYVHGMNRRHGSAEFDWTRAFQAMNWVIGFGI